MKTLKYLISSCCLIALLPLKSYADGTTSLEMNFTGKITNPTCLFAFSGEVRGESAPAYTGGYASLDFGNVAYSDIDSETPSEKSVDRLFSLDIHDCRAIASPSETKQMEVTLQGLCDTKASVIPNISIASAMGGTSAAPVGVQISYALKPDSGWQTLSVGAACPGQADAARFNLEELDSSGEGDQTVYSLPLKASLLTVSPWKDMTTFYVNKGKKTLTVQFDILYY